MAKGYYIMELASIFLAMGVISGLIGGLSPNAIARLFVKGSESIAFGALVVGVARAILVVMTMDRSSTPSFTTWPMQSLICPSLLRCRHVLGSGCD